jgi:hypothetical protein
MVRIRARRPAPRGVPSAQLISVQAGRVFRESPQKTGILTQEVTVQGSCGFSAETDMTDCFGSREDEKPRRSFVG